MMHLGISPVGGKTRSCGVNFLAEFHLNGVDLIVQSVNLEINQIETLIVFAPKLTYLTVKQFMPFENQIKFAVYIFEEDFQILFFHRVLR